MYVYMNKHKAIHAFSPRRCETVVCHLRVGGNTMQAHACISPIFRRAAMLRHGHRSDLPGDWGNMARVHMLLPPLEELWKHLSLK